MLELIIEDLVRYFESPCINFDAKSSFREKYELLLYTESPVNVHRDWMKRLEA